LKVRKLRVFWPALAEKVNRPAINAAASSCMATVPTAKFPMK
jgi:hypothetical protein